MLESTASDLGYLLRYLKAKHGIKLSLDLLADPEQDEFNKKEPRAFCYVIQGENAIHCTEVLELVSSNVRIGLLLHEIGHIVNNAFKGDQSEVVVDEWCKHQVPESGYYYGDYSYISPWTGEMVTAKNIEHVSREFLTTIARSVKCLLSIPNATSITSTT